MGTAMDFEVAESDRSDTTRLLATLERLLAIEAVNLSTALDCACLLVAEALHADKVDAMFHDLATDTLVVAGTSPTPMGQKQRAIGMHRLQRANGGREVAGYLSGQPYATGRADRDPEQLRGITEGLGVRSVIIVPLIVDGTRRGVFLASSAHT